MNKQEKTRYGTQRSVQILRDPLNGANTISFLRSRSVYNSEHLPMLEALFLRHFPFRQNRVSKTHQSSLFESERDR